MRAKIKAAFFFIQKTNHDIITRKSVSNTTELITLMVNAAIRLLSFSANLNTDARRGNFENVPDVGASEYLV